ncbi:hypothetical protein [Alteribacter natronophilus]|uniref:hypothetical protein n=1 Tax=Alteribacter natronophilus TaxID=2583810 RepID=UPI00110EFF6C|nr:hypothetical protein [Alteribacter natronophilus]TMW72880.1 hypothetical protein FGB90_00780 [Alteribacter natronophilus]
MRTPRDIQRSSVQMEKTNRKSLIMVGLGGILFLAFVIVMYQIGVDGIEVISSAAFFYLGMLFLANTVRNYREKRRRWILYLGFSLFFAYLIITIITGHFASQ